MERGCEPYAGLVNDYLAGELDWVARADLEAHLDDCADCRAELDGMREAFEYFGNELTADASSFSLSASRVEFLKEAHAESRAENRIVSLAAVREAAAPAPARRSAKHALRGLGLAASFLFVAYLSVQALRQSDPSDPVGTQIASVQPRIEEPIAEAVSPEPGDLSTYGLIVPVARDTDAERESLFRLSSAAEPLYEYPPAYGLEVREPSVQRTTQFYGVDGPTPYVTIHDDGHLLAL